jgi:hypothetical protein
MTKGDAIPKILQVARFTTPVHIPNPQENNNYTPTRSGKEFNDIVLLAIDSSSQPLTAKELCAMLTREFGRGYHDSSVRTALNELVEQGKVFSRSETREERTVRAGGAKVRALAATLYSTNSVVPTRTLTEAVPGIRLVDESGIPWSKTQKPTSRPRPWSKKKSQRDAVEFTETTPAVSAGMETNEMIDYLIGKIVAEKTAEIQKELDSAIAELKRLRDFLKSAI